MKNRHIAYYVTAHGYGHGVRSCDILGALLMVSGSACIIAPQQLSLHSGDVLIVLACMFPPFGNLAAKHARALVKRTVLQ